jgi:hypothetical protein
MEKNTYEKIRKYSLKAIQLIVIFMLLDFLSTFVAIKVLDIAKEQNPIALALWESSGFWKGSIFLIGFSLSTLIFMYFGIMFAPANKKIGKTFLIFTGSLIALRIIAGILTLINNYAILINFFLSKL